MRAVAIFGPNASESALQPFQSDTQRIPIAPDLSASGEAEVALIFGGDGTIHRHLAALVERGIPVLVVPFGSGNDFAVALGVRTRNDALAAWKKFLSGGGNVRRVDVGRITPLGEPGATPTYYCCVAGAGVDSDANRRANAQSAWLRRNGGYTLAVLQAIFSFKPRQVTVQATGADPANPAAGAPAAPAISEPGWMVAFANAPTYGGGMRIAPRAQLDDGKLDVCFLRRTGRLSLLRLFPKVFSGAHVSRPQVTYFQATGLRVETESPLDVYADGEYVCRTPVEVGILPGALRVIVP
ncbi:MAG TPA: diacylglycerol kinase family protein [Terriglobales bacterium]|nr:diacylglycerol kinase family protein [Terriglobales bacterium]